MPGVSAAQGWCVLPRAARCAGSVALQRGAQAALHPPQGRGASGALSESLRAFDQRLCLRVQSLFSHRVVACFKQPSCFFPASLYACTFVSPRPACFNAATVFLSPRTGDKITGLEREFAFISFVFWVFFPGNLHADVPAPCLLWSGAAAAGCGPAWRSVCEELTAPQGVLPPPSAMLPRASPTALQSICLRLQKPIKPSFGVIT